MKPGDRLVMYSGEILEVKESFVECLDKPVKVYNFEVEDWHTYFVSVYNIFVHNAECGGRLDVALNKAKQNNVEKVHNNSLSTKKPAVGYTLRDKTTGEILKFGETTNPKGRYSKKYLMDNNAEMVIEANGTKQDMHIWQNEMITDYKLNNGDLRPPLNKSDW